VSGPVRVFAFAAAVAAAFVGALGVGAAVGPLERGRAEATPSHGEAMSAAAVPAGLAVAADGLRLEAARTTVTSGRPAPFAFRILRADGTPLDRYELSHERRMHLVVVRRDLGVFRHLHPTLGSDGTWRVRLPALPPGAYRAFADFTSGGAKRTLGVDLLVPGAWRPGLEAADVPVELAPVGPIAGRETSLRFRVPGGAKVGRYLGARGHLVVLRRGDLAYLHTHADEEALRFDTTFPTPGSYRAFLQVRLDGAVRTASFTIEVPR
jgi:hypothetical protein